MVSKVKSEFIDKLLSKHGLRKTSLRRNMLSAFLYSRKPLTQASLITSLSKENRQADRVLSYEECHEHQEIEDPGRVMKLLDSLDGIDFFNSEQQFA